MGQVGKMAGTVNDVQFGLGDILDQVLAHVGDDPVFAAPDHIRWNFNLINF